MAPPVTWVLADDRPGNANQALGVAQALGWPFAVKTLRYGRLARLPDAVLGRSCAGLCPTARDLLQPPWPGLVIAAGRRSAPVARWLRRQSPGLLAVQLMWPGSARGLDLVAVPEHDRVPDDAAVIRTLGTPHGLTTAGLAAAAAAIAGQVAAIPRPRIACLVGGSTRRRPFTPADALHLARSASGLASDRGGGLLVTTSRRTGEACTEALASGLFGPHLLDRWAAGAADRHVGFLGSADAVIVSADSTAMVTEACATGRPVFLYQPAAGVAAKHERLHRRLRELGHAQPLGALWPASVPPLANPAVAVATAIRAALDMGPTAAPAA